MGGMGMYPEVIWGFMKRLSMCERKCCAVRQKLNKLCLKVVDGHAASRKKGADHDHQLGLMCLCLTVTHKI